MRNIWLSGSINSGKSTVSKILSKELKMVCLELDSFSCFVEEFMSFNEYIKLNYEIVSEIVEVYNRHSLGVIVVYPIREDKNYDLTNSSSNFKFFTIDPCVEIALTDRGERKLNDWERKQISCHYAQSVHDLSFGTRIDSRNLTPEETAERIISLIN